MREELLINNGRELHPSLLGTSSSSPRRHGLESTLFTPLPSSSSSKNGGEEEACGDFCVGEEMECGMDGGMDEWFREWWLGYLE